MSYEIGQFRKDLLSSSNYITNLPYTSTTIETESDSVLNVSFTDRVLQLNTSLEYGKNYFLKVGIIRKSSEQKFNIILKNNTSTTSSTQTISTFTIPALDNTNNTIAIAEAIISPNSAYNQIVLQLSRTAEDFITVNEQGTIGRIMEISTADTLLGEMTNILNNIGQSSVTKIGVQGPSGLLMCINGQEIRIGPNGVYEIKNGYTITFIGFAILPKEDPADEIKDYFILDYQY